MRKALAVGRKEFRQILRDRRSLLVLLFVPAFFLLLYGYALNFDVQHIRLAVEDDDRTPASRALISSFVNSGYFDLVASVTDNREYERLIDLGDVRAVLVIPRGMERKLLTGQRVPVQVILNGDNSNAAATVMGYALRIIQTASAEYQVQPITRQGTPGPVIIGGAARLVQPGAAQRVVPRPGTHCLHRHDLVGHLDRALGRARKGAGHDGTGEDGAAQHHLLHRRQDAAVFLHLHGDVDYGDSGVDGALRAADERLMAAADPVGVVVPGRCTRARADDFDRRRLAAGGVSDGHARVVSADDDAVRVRVSDRQHAGADSRGHLHRARPIFPRGAPIHRAQRRRTSRCSGSTSSRWPLTPRSC